MRMMSVSMKVSSMIKEEGDDGTVALRRTVAKAVTEEMFNNFKSYQEAELYDYQFMSSIDRRRS